MTGRERLASKARALRLRRTRRQAAPAQLDSRQCLWRGVVVSDAGRQLVVKAFAFAFPLPLPMPSNLLSLSVVVAMVMFCRFFYFTSAD